MQKKKNHLWRKRKSRRMNFNVFLACGCIITVNTNFIEQKL